MSMKSSNKLVPKMKRLSMHLFSDSFIFCSNSSYFHNSESPQFRKKNTYTENVRSPLIDLQSTQRIGNEYDICWSTKNAYKSTLGVDKNLPKHTRMASNERLFSSTLNKARTYNSSLIESSMSLKHLTQKQIDLKQSCYERSLRCKWDEPQEGHQEQLNNNEVCKNAQLWKS